MCNIYGVPCISILKSSRDLLIAINYVHIWPYKKWHINIRSSTIFFYLLQNVVTDPITMQWCVGSNFSDAFIYVTHKTITRGTITITSILQYNSKVPYIP